jgi:hypothetical protein
MSLRLGSTAATDTTTPKQCENLAKVSTGGNAHPHAGCWKLLKLVLPQIVEKNEAGAISHLSRFL